MYKKILIPLDGSELAEEIFPYVVQLARRLNLDLVFLHVCTPEERPFNTMHKAYIERMAERVNGVPLELLKRPDVSIVGKPLHAIGKVVIGHPAKEIINYAKNTDVDFILMATHGYSGLRRWVMGSVSEKVIRASNIPVLITRNMVLNQIPYDKWLTDTMVVPLDGSELSEWVIPHVKKLAKQQGNENIKVILLRICETLRTKTDYPYIDFNEYEDKLTEHCKQLSEKYLREIKKRLQSAGLDVESSVITGSPAQEIIEYARKNPLDLIIMATRGHSAITHWAFGSVADKIIHGVANPIFLIRPSKT